MTFCENFDVLTILTFIAITVLTGVNGDGDHCFVPCHTSSNPDRCAKTMFECFKPYIKAGTLVNMKVEPIKFPHFAFDNGFLFKANATNLVIHGATDYSIDTAKYTVNKKKFNFKGKLPSIQFTGNFNSLYMGYDLWGDVEGTLTNNRYDLTADVGTRSGCQGLIKYHLTIGHMDFRLLRVGGMNLKITIEGDEFKDQIKSRIEGMMTQVFCKIFEELIPRLNIPP